MASILCLSIAGIIVSTWPHSQFTLSSEPSDARAPTQFEGVWRIDGTRQRLERLPVRNAGQVGPPSSATPLARSESVREPGVRRGASVERMPLARSGTDARDWVICSDGACSGIASLVEASLAQSGLLAGHPVELSPCTGAYR